MATPRTAGPAADAAARIGPDDPRYRAVVEKRFNKRFRASPEYVRPASSADEVAAAVEEAVREGRRLAVTSGGHCLEGFVSDPDVRVVVDVSPMKRVAYDADRRAIEVGAGATVGETVRALHEAWGVVVPLGQHPAIGMGGHSRRRQRGVRSSRACSLGDGADSRRPPQQRRETPDAEYSGGRGRAGETVRPTHSSLIRSSVNPSPPPTLAARTAGWSVRDPRGCTTAASTM